MAFVKFTCSSENWEKSGELWNFPLQFERFYFYIWKVRFQAIKIIIEILWQPDIKFLVWNKFSNSFRVVKFRQLDLLTTSSRLGATTSFSKLVKPKKKKKDNQKLIKSQPITWGKGCSNRRNFLSLYFFFSKKWKIISKSGSYRSESPLFLPF